MGNIEFIKTTRAKYNALSKDVNALYLITDTGELAIQNKIFKQDIGIRDKIYVSPNGNNSNDGSSAAPLLTIQAAVDKSKYSYVFVSPGIYNESVTVERERNISLNTINGAVVTLNRIIVNASTIEINKINFKHNGTMLSVQHNSIVTVNNCHLDGINKSFNGIILSMNSYGRIYGTTVTNCNSAFKLEENSNIRLVAPQDLSEIMSNNLSATVNQSSNIFTSADIGIYGTKSLIDSSSKIVLEGRS